MTNEQQAAQEQWYRREHTKLEGMQMYAIAQYAGYYSPDRTFLVLGEGASGRLLTLLNEQSAALAITEKEVEIANKEVARYQAMGYADVTELNNLKAALAIAVAEVERLKSMAPYVEASGHYCDGMTEAWSDAQAAGAALATTEKKAELADACIGLMYNPLLVETPEAKEWLRRAMEAGMGTEHPRSLHDVLTAMKETQA